jgi:hypothetical protein
MIGCMAAMGLHGNTGPQIVLGLAECVRIAATRRFPRPDA